MSAWGPAIFSDDLAADLRGQYVALLSIGKNDAEAEKLVLEYYAPAIGTEEETALWFALALVEWKKGRLSEFAKDKALSILNNGGDLERWNRPGNEKNYAKRVKVIEGLRRTLLSPMPAKKKIRKPTIHRCPWKVGSLLAYRIVNCRDKLEMDPYYGKYVLLRVLQIDKEPVSRIVPEECFDESYMLVALYRWVGDAIPDPKIVDGLDYVPIEDSAASLKREHLNFSRLAELTDEQREAIEKQLLALTERRVETCSFLNWKPYGDARGDITYLDCDPSYEKETPSYFKTGITECSLTHYRAFDLTLATRLKQLFG